MAFTFGLVLVIMHVFLFYATQPMIDKPLDQLRYKKPIEDSPITYDVLHFLGESAL